MTKDYAGMAEEIARLNEEIDAYRMTGKPMEGMRDLLIERDTLRQENERLKTLNNRLCFGNHIPDVEQNKILIDKNKELKKLLRMAKEVLATDHDMLL